MVCTILRFSQATERPLARIIATCLSVIAEQTKTTSNPSRPAAVPVSDKAQCKSNNNSQVSIFTPKEDQQHDKVSTITHSLPSSDNNNNDLHYPTARATALQCLEYAANNAILSASALATSIQSILQGSTLAVSLARKSEAEAERAAEWAIGSARQADEAGRLARAQAEEPKEFGGTWRG